MRNIAILASGSGTNAENIIRCFSNSEFARVKIVLSNKAEAYVLKRAESLHVQSMFFDRRQFYGTGEVLECLIRNKIDFIVLAGFLWLVPGEILRAYDRRIVNIHPGLLPGYGGKGMYGSRVHKSVIENHEKESGITIHYVNDIYDNGDIIFQARCSVDANDTPDTLAAKVHALEYRFFPEVIADLVSKLPSRF